MWAPSITVHCAIHWQVLCIVCAFIGGRGQISTVSLTHWEQICFVTHNQGKVKEGRACISCQKLFVLLRHMLVSHDHELMAMCWYCRHTSSSPNHVMVLPRVLKGDRKNTVFLARSPAIFLSSSVVDLAPACKTLESEGVLQRMLKESAG